MLSSLSGLLGLRRVLAVTGFTCQEASVIMFRISHPGQSEITNLEITGRIQQEVAGLEISVKDVG